MGIRSSALFGLRPYHEEAAVTIYHGDCRQILPMLGRFDLLLTDPPYGIGEGMKAARRTKTAKPDARWRGRGCTDYEAGEWDDEPVPAWLMELARSMCDKQIIFGGNYYHLPPCKGPLVWDKENGDSDFADGEMAWNNLGCALRIKRHLWAGMRRLGNETREHPTQKPLAVIQWALSLAGDVETILDPWAGSGTTGHAAEPRQTRRADRARGTLLRDCSAPPRSRRAAAGLPER